MVHHLLTARIVAQILQHCSVFSVVMGQHGHCRGRAWRQRPLSQSCRSVCVAGWRVLSNQRELHKTFKGTAQWGVLADCRFRQLENLTTQPQLTDLLTQTQHHQMLYMRKQCTGQHIYNSDSWRVCLHLPQGTRIVKKKKPEVTIWNLSQHETRKQSTLLHSALPPPALRCSSTACYTSPCSAQLFSY